MTNRPLLIDAAPRGCAPARPQAVQLVYWTDRAALPRRIPPAREIDEAFEFEVPLPSAPAVLYYYFDARWPQGEHPIYRTTPPEGDETPYVYFLTEDHLGDLDVHGDLLDVFDVIRMARHHSWGEALPWADRLDLNRDGRADDADLRRAIGLLLADQDAEPRRVQDASVRLVSTPEALTIRLHDGSAIEVPRMARRLTDANVDGGLADNVLHRTRSLARIAAASTEPVEPADVCLQFENISVNRQFYREEPHMMRRHLALALDNIQRAPLAYLKSCVYRAMRLFIVEGSADQSTAQQFTGSMRLYRFAQFTSIVYLSLFGAGVVVAIRRRLDAWLFLALIAYVPATISFLLINMRYSVTVQPYMFVFVAIALEALVDRSPDGL